MAHAALPAEQNTGHADLIGTFLWKEYSIVAITAFQPLGVLFMRINHIRHAALHLAHNYQIHDEGLRLRVLQIDPWLDQPPIKRLDPIDAIAIMCFRQILKCLRWPLQRMRAAIRRVMYPVVGRLGIGVRRGLLH